MAAMLFCPPGSGPNRLRYDTASALDTRSTFTTLSRRRSSEASLLFREVSIVEPRSTTGIDSRRYCPRTSSRGRRTKSNPSSMISHLPCAGSSSHFRNHGMNTSISISASASRSAPPILLMLRLKFSVSLAEIHSTCVFGRSSLVLNASSSASCDFLELH
jgi:hypothetical protein